MIATVTLNPALDKSMTIPGFAAGRTNRASIGRVEPGGKGINVAKALKQLGCPVIALGFLAASDGRAIADALASSGIPGDFVTVPGETRVNLKIKDPLTGVETEINEPGFRVEPGHLKALERKIEEMAAECPVMVFSGSLPPGAPPDVYAGFIRIARHHGVRTILDTNGAALKHGIGAGPDLIKPNLAEAEELLGEGIEGEQQLVRAARRLLAMGPRVVVISMGPDGALAASSSELWRAHPPSVKASSSNGAGDAMVAGLAFAMTRELPLADALRLAMGAAAASVATNGSGAELESIQTLSSGVVLRHLSETGEVRQ